MRILFSILSIAYIAGIFLFARSPIVDSLARFNPYSLLHIPLYGILAFLLLFSFVPMKFKSNNAINPINSTNSMTRFLIAGFIALGVSIVDEIYQAYVPGRDASVTDVFLDAIGIILVLFFAFRLLKTKANAFTH